MDYAALWAEIQATPACEPYITPSEPKVAVEIAVANDQAIADILNVGRMRVAARPLSERAILAEYPDGPVAADAVLVKLETYAAGGHPLSSVLTRALRLLRDPEGLDFGAAATRSMLDALAAANAITTAEADSLKALALHPETITAADVSRAVRGPH